MKLLKRWLDSSGMTQVEFGLKEGVKQPTVRDWLIGKTSPTNEKLLSLSKSTGIPIAKLVRDCADDERARREERNAA